MPFERRTVRSRTLGMLAVALLLGTACGDDSPDPRSGPTATPVSTATATATATVLPPPATPTRTASLTPTGTPAGTASATITPTGVPTGTTAATLTPTDTPAGTVSATITFTPTGTPTGTVSATVTPTCDPCGNGVVGHCEQCDDGNTLDGDCCSSDCRFEPAGSSCDDGDACTEGDACDGAGQCASEPLCGNGVLDPTCGEECDGSDDVLCEGRCLFDCTCPPEPTCETDPSRIIFAGGPGSEACQLFAGNRRLCEQAFHLGRGGVASCWYDAESESCQGCGPANHDAGLCTNTCRPVLCAGDEKRTVFTGGPTFDNCGRFDGDPAGCATAFALGAGGVASCWYEAEDAACRTCDPSSMAEGLCVNACAACAADPSRTLFAGGPRTQACRRFDGDQESCERAFHRDSCRRDASCYYSAGECRGCGPENQIAGECQNTCVAGPPTCEHDPSRTIFAGGPGTSACRQFNDDPTSCQQAFHRSECGLATSCFYDFRGRQCRGCGRRNLLAGACLNTCDSGPPPCKDTERMVFAGLASSSSCLDLGLAAGTAACEAGYQVGASGSESCFMDGSVCTGCDPESEAEGSCFNGCVNDPPSCAADPERAVFAGGPGTGACRQFAADQEACESAFHLGKCGVASCFLTRSGNCSGCGPANLQNGECANTCNPPACPGEPARDLFLGGPGTSACTTLDGNPSACARAFHLGADGVASCWYDAENERCRGCGPNNQDAGLCANTCVICERDPSRTLFTRARENCAQFAADRQACESAFEIGDECPGPVSCFYDESSADCHPCDLDAARRGRCTNTCASGPPVCEKDPSRTTFAGGPSTGACRQFDGNPAACLAAFHRGESGIASCWYDFEEASCKGCGPTNQQNELCINTCLHGPPACDLDPSRTIFLGIPSGRFCREFDGDPILCEKAFHFTDCLQPVSCFYEPMLEECHGCGPDNPSGVSCINTCVEGPPSCPLDPSRVLFAGTPGTSACRQFDADRVSCLAAFHVGECGAASCFHDGGSCRGCGPTNELNGNCFNTCRAP